MPSLLPRKRSSRVLLCIIVAVVFLGIVAGRKYGKPYIRAWREQKSNADARAFLAKGDYGNARLSVNKIIGQNPNNIEAWKLGVEIAEKQESPDLFIYTNRLATAQ